MQSCVGQWSKQAEGVVRGEREGMERERSKGETETRQTGSGQIKRTD